jgi:hypothetical protein
MIEVKTCDELTAEMRTAWEVIEAGGRMGQEGERMEEDVERQALASGITMDDVLFPLLEEWRAQQPEPAAA